MHFWGCDTMNTINIAWNELKKRYIRPNLAGSGQGSAVHRQGGYEPRAHVQQGMENHYDSQHDGAGGGANLVGSEARKRMREKYGQTGAIREKFSGYGVQGQHEEGVGQEHSLETHGGGESVFDNPSFLPKTENPEAVFGTHPTQQPQQQRQQRQQPPQGQPPQGQIIQRGYPMRQGWGTLLKESMCKGKGCEGCRGCKSCPKCKPKGSTCEKEGC